MTYRAATGPELNQAAALVVAHHYSQRAPGGVRLCGTWWEGARMVAACFLSEPPTRWSEPVMELSRLVRVPGADSVSLTQLISQTLKSAKARADLPRLVVSFADNTQGHHGGVYQAASWGYTAFRQPSCDGFDIDGEFVPRRTAYGRYGTSSVDMVVAIAQMGGQVATPHYDAGKHLYWKAVDREGEKVAARLGLQKLPYPKTTSDMGRLRTLLVAKGILDPNDRTTDIIDLVEAVCDGWLAS